MLTIAIDENGHFNHDEVSFVGGYIYTGEDYMEEKLRLFEFLKETCKSFDLQFPNDMHYDQDGKNKRKVRYFEDNIEKPLSDYLVKNGKYHLILMIKSRKERKDFMNISNLVDDRKANNLYEHMVSSILRNILFNNIGTKDQQNICIEIPTRVSVIEKDDKDKLEEFRTLGYDGKEIINGEKYMFYSTDHKTFKTALSSMIMNSNKRHSTKFESINIQSINYRQESVDMAYLYLADTICNSFKRKLSSSLDISNYRIQDIQEWAKNFTGGNEPYLWAYDDIDSLYNNIMEEYGKKNFIETLKALNNAKNTESDFVKHYNKNFFKEIEENIENAFDVNNLNIYISQLDNYYKKSNINYSEGIFIFDNLWKIAMVRKEKIDKATLYGLADIGIRAYNHLGTGKENNPYYQICEDLKQYVPIETYLDTLNRSIQIHVNEFDFDKAIEKQSYILDCLDILKKAIMDISELNDSGSNTSTRLTSRGRALSSLGQFYAFKRNEKALFYFEEASKEFIDMDKGNNHITISHILNFASDQKDIKVYERYSPIYFGGEKEINKQLAYLNETGKGSAFGFYTYFKGVNQLYIDQADDDFIEKILSIDFVKQKYNTSSHPWQLIYKNIGMILYKKGRLKDAIKYMDKSLKCIDNPSGTISAINHFTNIQKNFYIKNDKKLNDAIKEFEIWLSEESNMQKYFNEVFIGEASEIYNKLYEKFTFTYI